MIPVLNCTEFDSMAFQFLPVITWIGAVLNIFGLYIILFRSPKSMADYAKYLTVYQITCALCDITLGALLTPLFVFPLAAGTPIGLLRDMGIDVRIQIIIGFTLMFGMTGTVMLLFLYKQQKILFPGSWWKLSERGLVASCISIEVIMILPQAILNVTFFMEDEKEVSRSLALEKYPQFRCVIEDPFFYSYTPLRQKVIASFFLLVCVSGCVFVSVCLLSSFKTLVDVAQFRSAKQLQQQRNGIHILIIQTLLPLSILMLPIALAVMCILTENMGMTVLCPWIVFCLGVHGISSTLCTLLLIEPYRKFIVRILMRRKGSGNGTAHDNRTMFISAIHAVQVLPTHRTSNLKKANLKE